MADDSPAGLDRGRLARHLVAEGLLDSGDELDARLLAGGYSNLSYELRGGGRHMVLRREPLGNVAPKAHDMSREFTVLSALSGTSVPVPRTLHYCADREVIGSPFYVMDFVAGSILRDADATAALDRGEREACGNALVDTLAAIHTVDVDGAALGEFGRPEGFVERQLGRWTSQLASMPTRDAVGFAELGGRLRRALPRSDRRALLHGDFRIDNVVLDPADPGQLVAVLDWEMSTLGDPLVDLGMLMLHWGAPGEDPLTDVQAAMSWTGFPTRAVVIGRYAERVGIDAGELDFYVVLAHFKMAVVTEGIYNRMRSGYTVGSDFDRITEVPLLLLSRGLELASASALTGLASR